MRFGAETNTRWLWFITYILLPLNVIGQTFVLFWLLDVGQGGLGLVIILAELGLAIATILGLHQQKPWGWYCIMVMFGIQLIGTPLKVHAKAAMRYEITQAANSYLQSQGRSPLTTSKPSIFDLEPMLTFFLLLGVWTIPNAIYMYQRRHMFGITEQSQSIVAGRTPAVSPAHPTVSDLPFTAQSNTTDRHLGARLEATFSDFEVAQSEIDEGKVAKGVWAKASSEALLDEAQTKALYIRYRAQQLAEEQSELREQQRLKHKLEKMKLHPEHTGTCPQCGYQGPFGNESTTNVWLFLLLLCLGVIPGLVYATQTIRLVCPKCGHARR